MTKHDLLHLLEPFDDDIRIFVKGRHRPNIDLSSPSVVVSWTGERYFPPPPNTY